MNDITTVNWRKLRLLLPHVRGYALNRIATLDEIKEIYAACDTRGKALTLTLLTSGISEGSIQILLLQLLFNDM